MSDQPGAFTRAAPAYDRRPDIGHLRVRASVDDESCSRNIDLGQGRKFEQQIGRFRDHADEQPVQVDAGPDREHDLGVETVGRAPR
jgi:hypothetical protein